MADPADVKAPDRQAPGPLAGGDWPFVSVILPVRNESAFIGISLGSVLKQDYPLDRMEVLVVDGQSTDDTRECVKAMSRDTFPVKLLDNPKRIIPSAMNVGLAAARGPIILRVDGHSTIAPDYVRRAVLALKRTGAQNVGCGVYNKAVNYPSRAISAATGSPFGVGGSTYHFDFKEQETDCVFMGAFPKWVLEHLGGYNEEMACNEDDELSFRLRKAGGRVVLVPELESQYYPRSSFLKMTRQFFRYGYWKVRVMQLHPRQMRPSHFVPAAFTLALAGGAPLAVFVPIAGWTWLGMVVLWSLGAVAASVPAAKRDGWDLFPVLPLTFFLLHVSYGGGFLAGLVRFLPKWFMKKRVVKRLPTDTPVWETIERASRSTP